MPSVGLPVEVGGGPGDVVVNVEMVPEKQVVLGPR